MRWPVAAFATIGVATAVAVTLLVGSGTANSNKATAGNLSANPISATATAAKSVDMSSVPEAKAGTLSGKQQSLPLLTRFGTAAGLAAAKAEGERNAPSGAGYIVNAPGPSGSGAATVNTPGGAGFVANFNGMQDSAAICQYFGAGCQPPDMGVASNGNSGHQVVQVVNTSLAVYSTGGALAPGFPKSLQNFFGVPNVGGCDPAHGNQPFLSDPRIQYDPYGNRFIVAALQVEGGFGIAPSCPAQSTYWVAFSKTADPTGAWWVYAINTAFSGGLADYTQLGFNPEGVFLGGNQFNIAGTAFIGDWVVGFSKAAGESGGAISINGFIGFNDGAQLFDTVQPTISLGADGGPAGELLINSYNDNGTNAVVVWDFANVLGLQGNPPTLTGIIVPTAAFSEPPNASNGTGCDDCIESLDNRIATTPIYALGNVYFAHATALNNGSSVEADTHWGIVHPVITQTAIAGCTRCAELTGATSLVDQGYFGYSGLSDTWFPAISPDREGNLFLAFEFASSSIGVAPSSAIVSRRVSFGGSWPDSGAYLQQSLTPTTNGRWGDYEAIDMDTFGTGLLWIGTEFSNPAGGDWATKISAVKYANQTNQ